MTTVQQTLSIRQELQEIEERNAVECKIGYGKRKLVLSLIMAKLQITAEPMIGMGIFILNMENDEAKEAADNRHYFEG